MLDWQLARFPEVTREDVTGDPRAGSARRNAEVAGLAISSGRSLFAYGPPGNGKTSLGRMLHGALKGSLWIPTASGSAAT